ncbi:hypothetical protein LV85_03438 [Algoriphagus chordae]|uniref:Uncharacterized protein n=1 Tax=Algoriphagus chordae TaxID=237019 RepID=A0A2W7QKA0_9BACT|nr:hypothetical protein LV85_03438 [Algoriphagus chordae]
MYLVLQISYEKRVHYYSLLDAFILFFESPKLAKWHEFKASKAFDFKFYFCPTHQTSNPLLGRTQANPVTEENPHWV